MRIAVRPRRPSAITITAAVVLALVLGAILRVPVAKGTHPPCTGGVLGDVDGHLIRWGDAPLLLFASWNGHSWLRLALSLPEGWTVRPGDGSELEVVRAGGGVVARTGTHAYFSAANMGVGTPEPEVRDDVLYVCQ